MRPFEVSVNAILRSRSPKRIELEAPIDDLFVSASAVPKGVPVRIDVVLEPVGASIEAIGSVMSAWQGDCCRCLQPARGVVAGEVQEVFEDYPVEGESYPLVHGEIDLEPMAREAILLELPQAPLCREDCLGLCPTCGADRNESDCECVPTTDVRWAALDQLRDSPT